MVTGPLEKARLYLESHSRLSEEFPARYKKEAGPCITFSRETGAGAETIADKLLSRLSKYNREDACHWTVFNKNLIERVLEEHNLPDRFSKYLVEDKLTDIHSVINELLGVQPAQHLLVKKISKTVLQLAHIGNSIIIGRGATIITSQQKNVFHVRLVAPFEQRVNYVGRILNLTKQNAIDFVRREDAARKNYVLTNFNKNIEDPLLYHLIVNTGQFSFDETAVLIEEAVLKKYPDFFRREPHFFEMYY